MRNLPPYMLASPIGVHIMDLQAFFQSPHTAPPSRDPERGGWASDACKKELSQLFPSTTSIGLATFNILIYNKSRDTDRICPACRRWYRVGEAPAYDSDGGAVFGSFEEFTRRCAPDVPPDLGRDEVAREQDLSGICSRVCMATINAGDDSQFGLDIDKVTPEQISRHNAKVQRATGWSLRKTTAEEEASMGGVKLLYVKS